MSRIDNNGIHVGFYESLYALKSVGSDTHTCCHTQTALIILASHRFIFSLGDVLIGNQAYELVIIVQDGQLLYLVLLQYLCRSTEIGLNMCSNKIAARHHFIDRTVNILFEAKVAIRNDTYQMTFIVHHRDATDVVLRHQFKRITDTAATLNGNGVINHAVLSTLHYGHLTCLFLNAHILVNDTNASLAGDSNSHRGLSDCIHGCRYEGNLQFDMA